MLHIVSTTVSFFWCWAIASPMPMNAMTTPRPPSRLAAVWDTSLVITSATLSVRPACH